MNANEFDLDFDFEKEYGSDPLNENEIPEIDEDFDLRAILESNFNEEAALFTSEYENDFDYGPEEETPAEEESPAADLEEDLTLDFDFGELNEEELNSDEAPAEESQPEEVTEAPAEPEEPKVSQPPRRRKPVSKARQFKNETLPLLIMGITAVLIVFFVVGSISRAITNHIRNNEQQLLASESAANEQERQDREAQQVLAEAEELASGYDYDAAVAMLQAFDGDRSKYPDIDIRISQYQQAQASLIAHNDPGAVANLSFHVLIADPARAFNDKTWGGQYNRNFVTVDEFEKILEQLYANDYVLVDMDDIISETNTGGAITYAAKPLYLPDGKKPVMITETMVNYYAYMIDGNDDGEPDKEGAGFASRLVVDKLTGDIKAEMVNSVGETVVGDYDLVPILEKFIKAHPDFSYKGARATLAVSGHEGLFGYRTNTSVVEKKGQDYYDKQVSGAKEVASALRAKGYNIACYTYADTNYSGKAASDIQADIDKWTAEITPILGTVDTIVYAKMGDISSTGAYSGGKFNVLSNAGFRYFISHGNKPSVNVPSTYVRQLRIMVTGTNMAHSATMYSNYFDAKTVLNNKRGDVPKG